ncbi:hypothetical protein LWI28_014536 [Acer negundo]|uniref:KIB1-4 beta-propeller domain-containing protein n=1 Tax=Acer negundo TaxID=4023 RepID=A0AAD5JDI6_ACENE|nr:hypothetical protein LWI28_014536 [Acer negundo]
MAPIIILIFYNNDLHLVVACQRHEPPLLSTSNPVPSYAKPRIAALKLPNAASKSPKDRNALWRSYFTTFEPRGDFLVVLLSNNYKDVRFCSSKDNNWKVYTFAYQSWDIVDIVVYNGRVFVVTDDCRIGVLNLGSSNDSEMGVLILESSNIKFLKLKGTPHLGGKIRFVASNEQLLVVNFKDKPILMHLETRVYSIEFSTREWVKVNNFGGKALFLNNFTCLLSTNTTRWGEHSNYIYYLSSKNSHMCLVYSDSGEFVRHITCCTRTEHRDVPLICCWHFPNQFYSIKNVKDYDDDQFERFSNGYLIMKDGLSKAWVINPITAHHIQFPPMPRPHIATPKLSNAASKSHKGNKTLWTCYFATVGSGEDIRFCSSKDNNWKVYTFAYQSWDIVDIIIYNGRVFVVINDCQIGVLNLKSSNDSQMGVLILESSNLKFLKLKGTPHLGRKIRFKVSNKQLLVVNFKELPTPRHIDTQVYSIEWKENNFGHKALFLIDFTCSMSTNTTRWEEHND